MRRLGVRGVDARVHCTEVTKTLGAVLQGFEWERHLEDWSKNLSGFPIGQPLDPCSKRYSGLPRYPQRRAGCLLSVDPGADISIASETLPDKAKTQPSIILPVAFHSKAPFASAKSTSSSNTAAAVA